MDYPLDLLVNPSIIKSSPKTTDSIPIEKLMLVSNNDGHSGIPTTFITTINSGLNVGGK